MEAKLDLQQQAFLPVTDGTHGLFEFTERVRIEFRMEGYNVTNSFIPNLPNVDVLSSAFGRSTNQGNLGREFQYTARIHF